MAANKTRPAGNKAKPRAPEILPLDLTQQADFRARLMAWYRQNARILPWRGSDDPYRIWVSEIMLQQTRVDAVLDHFRRFLDRFPTMLSLALAPEDDVLALWSGLGYYRRARMLHRAAKFVVEELGGVLPPTAVALRTLPGVGVYTAAAIASIAFGEPVAVVDGNVERVLLRIAGRPEQTGRATEYFIEDFSAALLDRGHPGDSNQATMELGATVCLPRGPLCLQCPVYDFCLTRGEHTTLPRNAIQSARQSYGLTLRDTDQGTEILLHRRDSTLSLMPNMLELPPLPAAPEAEPRLRLRHAIVGTNYYVEVFLIDTRKELEQRIETDAIHALQWAATASLPQLPLTGLARKTLHRTGLLVSAEDEDAITMNSASSV